MINYIPKYFTLTEFCHSNTALKNDIENIPTWEHLDKLLKGAKVLDLYRDALGEAMHITSAYRCSKLNKLVGGSETSHHSKGDAFDIQIGKRTKADAIRLFNFIKEYNYNNSINIDQCFLEHNSKTKSWWVHIGFNFYEPHKMRNQYGEIVK